MMFYIINFIRTVIFSFVNPFWVVDVDLDGIFWRIVKIQGLYSEKTVVFSLWNWKSGWQRARVPVRLRNTVQTCTRADFTAGFGMGPGVTPPLWPSDQNLQYTHSIYLFCSYFLELRLINIISKKNSLFCLIHSIFLNIFECYSCYIIFWPSNTNFNFSNKDIYYTE